jgi:hypothetical protein
MAKQRPPWFVPRDSASVQYAFFLSHVGEDNADVQQLASAFGSDDRFSLRLSPCAKAR